MYSSSGHYIGTRGTSLASFQWQPTLTSHDPNPPIPIDTAAPPASTPVLRSTARMMAAVLAAWSVVTVTPLFASVVLAHTNDPTVAHPSRQLEPASVVRALHPEPAWDAQTTRKRVQPFVAPAVDNPPFSSRHQYAGDWPAPAWESQSRPKLAQGSAAVDGPPLADHRYRGEWPVQSWDAQHRPSLVPGAERNDPLPFHQRYSGEWPSQTWEAQTRPHLVPIQPVAPVDDPPSHTPASLYGPLASHYAPPTVTPLWARTLTSEGVPVTPVDDPPFQMRDRQDQPVELHWMPRTLTAISLARHAESVDNPPPTEPRYRGEWPFLTWGTQTRPRVIQGGGAVSSDTPPFSTRHNYAGEWQSLSWETQQRPKLVPIAQVSTADTPPFSQAKYRGEWPAQTWEAQRARQLPVSVTAVSVDTPPFSQTKYRGEWPSVSWEAQARPKLVPIPPHVPMAVLVRNVRGAVPTMDPVAGRLAMVTRVSGAVPTLDDIEGA